MTTPFYTPEACAAGRPSLLLVTARAEGRVEDELWVEDEGPGIHTDDLAHIFDKFYRGQSTRKSDVPGTGLGLAITQAIVEAHGSDIRAENRPGGGARFVLRLPVAS